MRIANAYPSASDEILLEFSNGEYGKVQIAKLAEGLNYDFLYHPLKAKSFVASDSQIEWLPIARPSKDPEWKKSGRVSADYLYQNARICSLDDMKYAAVKISAMNRAPTKAHPSHHVYDIFVCPFNLSQQFALSESIGGGHGESGGSRKFSLAELLAYPQWKEHFKLAGCEWGIPIIEHSGSNAKEAAAKLIAGVKY